MRKNFVILIWYYELKSYGFKISKRKRSPTPGPRSSTGGINKENSWCRKNTFVINNKNGHRSDGESPDQQKYNIKK